ncbi:hypothetical protein HNP46_005797 [Pseudomonas nitritireducens]|uniref:Uncharacterized protein n=1 Tax=Pseudomonas nitroreducens TaxID=46680 RepID=A0A7W7KQ30_PSENT|nr:hypothetical protein [Pseudomonas nitritireducens]MBB4866890.1 hypothetical protein [Pseudomonas nitritireducens]
MQQFVLQDSRSLLGSRVYFWADSGYTTDITQARLFTKESAVSQHECRETDVPWPLDYLTPHAKPAVDHQYLSDEEALATPNPSGRFFIQAYHRWDGNDLYWMSAAGGMNTNLARAGRFTEAEANEILAERPELKVWPVEYVLEKVRLVIKADDISRQVALKDTGIQLIRRKPKYIPMNCCSCGRFISETLRYVQDCPNCGQDNRP